MKAWVLHQYFTDEPPARRFPPPWSVEGRTIAPDEAAGLYVHFDEVRSRRAHHARNPNFDRDRRAGDRCSRVVALSLMGRWICCDAQSLTGSIL
jgi:hypothetical protein